MLSGFGFPWNKLGKLYKEEERAFARVFKGGFIEKGRIHCKFGVRKIDVALFFFLENLEILKLI